MSEKFKKYYDALDDLLDRPISYNPAFKKITASTVAGIFLSQCWYWSKRHKEDGGWFYKSQKEWEEETGLTRSEQETARKHCLRVGAMEEKLKGVPATMYYRVNKEKVYKLLGVQFAETPHTEIVETLQTSLKPSPEYAGKQQSDDYSNFNKVSETPPMIPSESAKIPALDFGSMNIPEAREVPSLKMYAKATDFFPGSVVWEYVHNAIIQNNLTFEKIHAAAVEWSLRGYKRENVKGVLDWAINGIPNGVQFSQQSKPAIDEKRVDATRQFIDKKYSGDFAPPPEGLRPNLQIKKLAQQKGIRR